MHVSMLLSDRYRINWEVEAKILVEERRLRREVKSSRKNEEKKITDKI